MLLSRPGWLEASELRVGLGCMRMSTDDVRDEERDLATIAAAAAAGVSVFDTARAYGPGPAELGHNERLLVRALRACDALGRARIVTKGGMLRTDGGWIPDGRAHAIVADCEASLVALDGAPIDLYLIHAPDPRTPWRTSVRALARLAEDGLVRAIGVGNVNRRQLDEALELAPVAAVEIALSPYDLRAVRGGVIERCAEMGVAVLAHAPLGGPRRAHRLARDPALVRVAGTRDATPTEVALAWLLGISPVVIAIPGARRPETARSAARAAALRLDAGDRAVLDRAFDVPHRVRPARGRTPAAADIVVVMGIQGAGKGRVAAGYAGRGYLRLNRDERGEYLRQIADALDDALAAGARQVVLDNTYLTRAARSYVIEAATRHRLAARCVWVDTPLAQAQANLVERLLERFGELPTPGQLREAARREPGLLMPTSQMRALRELEPPSTDEGFAAVEEVRFARDERPRGAGGVFVAASVLGRRGWSDAVARGDPSAPHLIFDWRPGASVDALDVDVARLSKEVSGPVEGVFCPHAAGPPRCWCRPPLPGLPLAFARAHGLDPARSILVGTGPAHLTLSTTLRATYLAI